MLKIYPTANNFLTIQELIESNVKIFNFDYPIFDEKYREVLEDNILNHYYFREIGCETAGKFLFKLRAKMNLIMPYYNKMYKAQNLDQRILDNYDVTEIYKRNIDNINTVEGVDTLVDNTSTFNNSTNNSSTTNSNEDITLNSDTPQVRIDITSNDYISSMNKNIGANDSIVTNTTKNDNTIDTNRTNQSNSSNTGKTTENWERTMKGNIGVQTDADAVLKYMSSLRNIDEMIIKELNTLFLLVY